MNDPFGGPNKENAMAICGAMLATLAVMYHLLLNLSGQLSDALARH